MSSDELLVLETSDDVLQALDMALDDIVPLTDWLGGDPSAAVAAAAPANSLHEPLAAFSAGLCNNMPVTSSGFCAAAGMSAAIAPQLPPAGPPHATPQMPMMPSTMPPIAPSFPLPDMSAAATPGGVRPAQMLGMPTA